MEVEALLVNEGDYVTKGTPLFRMTADSAEDLMKSYSDGVEQAEESVESAQSSLENTRTATTIIPLRLRFPVRSSPKNYNVGETITRDTNSESTLAVIYDLSSPDI